MTADALLTSFNNMEKYIAQDEIIGVRILQVKHVHLRYYGEHRYEERLVVVRLESGLQFSLQQDISSLSNTGAGFVRIYPYTGCEAGDVAFDSHSDRNLDSPITRVVREYESEFEFALVLENGFVLHNGYSLWGNSADLDKNMPEFESNFEDLNLPEK